jgi:tripartite-type tricarboxylate transporter receptor subunit TctC
MNRVFAGLLSIVAATSATVFTQTAAAQTYPTRTISIVLGYPPGGGVDIPARFIAARLASLSGQTVIVLNKAGANGNIAAQEVARAAPDGYTLMWAPSSVYSANMFLYKKLNYDARKDFTLISPGSQYGFVLAVNPKSPARTVAELTDLLKKKGDKAQYGSGSSTSMAVAELYKSMTGLETLNVPYKTMQDTARELGNGVLDFMFIDAPFGMGQLAGGQIRALAVTLPQRMPFAAEIPTMDEAGVKGYELTGWMALAAPAKTPPDIVAKLRGWMKQIVEEPETAKFLETAASVPFYLPPDKIDAYWDAQIDKWRKLIDLAKIEAQ